MRSIRFYISVFMVIGLISLSNVSFAAERYNIDVESVKNAAQKSFFDENAEVKWDAKVKNNTEESKTYEITVCFLNSKNEKIFETSKSADVKPKEVKVVTQTLLLETPRIQDIYSGYVTISEASAQTLTAPLNNNIDMSISKLSDESVLMAYTVKLKNNTDKSVTRDVTVAFLDSDNNSIRSETKKASFDAGESKMITNTMELSAFEAGRITTGHVKIN